MPKIIGTWSRTPAKNAERDGERKVCIKKNKKYF
jgi:hypothetical protein